jgi:hypothetical protein
MSGGRIHKILLFIEVQNWMKQGWISAVFNESFQFKVGGGLTTSPIGMCSG